MAGLIDFHVAFVPNRYGDHLQRRVGLLPLTGPIRTGPGWEEAVAASTLRVVDQWRALIHSLGDAGYSPFAGDGAKASRDRTYASNCIPSFLAVKERSRRCGHAPCPFCWSRKAWEVWEATDHALFASPEALHAAGPGASGKLSVSPFDLIHWSFSTTFPRRTRDAETGKDRDTLPGVVRRRIDGRGAWFQRVATDMGVLGGLYIEHFTPAHDAWRGTTNRLLAVPAGVEPPATWSNPKAEGSRSEVWIYRSPTRKEVVGVVARACRYPKGWMTGKPEDVVAILEARAKRRLSATFGLLRNGSARARGAEEGPR